MTETDPVEPDDAGGNYVSEWFGFRLFPKASSDAVALETWTHEQCPFLTRATGEARECIKGPKSRGVCTISTATPVGRRDWLVCPYRALDPGLLDEVARRLFNVPSADPILVSPAVRYDSDEARAGLVAQVTSGTRVFLYLDQKLGGEISLRKTPKSPEFSIDVTLLEIAVEDTQPIVVRFGALEIQTMDFHGSYEHAVKNLKDARRLHPKSFAESIDQNQTWIRDRIEGPNLSNVFKRTFYQMAFKFQLGQANGCAGCALAIPRAVWESWRHLLGDPAFEVSEHKRLASPRTSLPSPAIAWILPFDLEASAPGDPDRVRIHEVIETSAEALAYWALEVAPTSALEFAGSSGGIANSIRRRLVKVWPQLAANIRL